MTYDQKLMDKCIQHALKNPIQSRGRNTIGRMAALITNDKYEALGWNRYRTHPLMFKFSKNHNKICLHAEIDAFIRLTEIPSLHYSDGAIKDIAALQCDIYISRVLKDGTPALAKPCDTCMGALTYFGIRNIYWTK